MKVERVAQQDHAARGLPARLGGATVFFNATASGNVDIEGGRVTIGPLAGDAALQEAAARTNAFKLNEDICLPLEALAEVYDTFSPAIYRHAYRLVGDARGALAREQLRHRRLLVVRLSRVAQPGRAMDEVDRRFEFCCHLGELQLNRLELKDMITQEMANNPFLEETAEAGEELTPQEVQTLLDGAPELEAKALFEWLCEQHPGHYDDGQVRTVQVTPKGSRNTITVPAPMIGPQIVPLPPNSTTTFRTLS